MLKRATDICCSTLGLVILAPVWIPVAILVRMKMGSPVLFCQTRPGQNEKPFKMFKFRSMNSKKDAGGQLLPDHERLTRFGKFLRSTSLDELPELWNVLKGEMSLVGPRPLLMEYLPKYNDRQKKRHDVKPGITGWAQINGRNSINWDEKLELDVWYVENRTLLLDIKILFLTIMKVIRRDGISEPGQATQSKFQGSDSNNATAE